MLFSAFEFSMLHHRFDSCNCTPCDRVCVGSDDLFLGSYITWMKDTSANGIRQFVLFVLSLKQCSESLGTDLNEDFRRAILGDQDIGDGGSIIPSLETIIVEDSFLKKVRILLKALAIHIL